MEQIIQASGKGDRTVRFRVQIEEEDYILYNIYIAFHSKSGRRLIIRGRLFGLALSLFALLVMFVAGADRGLIVTEAIFLVVFSAIWFFVYPSFAKKNIRKAILKLKEEGRLPYEREALLEFKDDEIYEELADGTRHVPYSDIMSVEENGDYIYLRKGVQEAIIVPERCLNVPIADFLSFMNSKVKADK